MNFKQSPLATLSPQRRLRQLGKDYLEKSQDLMDKFKLKLNFIAEDLSKITQTYYNGNFGEDIDIID